MIAFEWSWLTQPANDEIIRALANDWGAVPITSLVQRLRKEFTRAQAQQLIEQAELRHRAGRKFSRAADMWFTRRGLEQATSEPIARYKASCFEFGSRVLDACCGIGGDALGLASRAMIQAIDRDEEMAFLCRRNLEVNGFSSTSAACCRFEEISIESFDGMHIDPDRRVAGRTLSTQSMVPCLTQILDKLVCQRTCVKLAPATPMRPEHESRVHREWVGHDRECKQQLLWLNHPQRCPGARSVTLIDREGRWERLDCPAGILQQSQLPVAEVLGEYLIEPHSAVVAGRLGMRVAESLTAQSLAAGVDLYTSACLPQSPFAAGFRILETVPCRWRDINALIRNRRYGPIEWKKRGIHVAWWPRVSSLKQHDGRPITVICTRWQSKQVAIVCQRL